MPHIQAPLKAKKGDAASEGPSSITEVREGPAKEEKDAADPLVSIASVATIHSKRASEGNPSVEEAERKHHAVPRGGSAITPSPYYRPPYWHEPLYYGWSGHSGHHSAHDPYGRGGRRLFPSSPILHVKDADDKEKSAQGKGVDEEKEEASRRTAYEKLSPPGLPPYSAYGMPPPYHPYHALYYDEYYARTALASRKRPGDSPDESSPKRTKVTASSDIEKKSPKEEDDTVKDDESNADSSQASAESKQRVISPASSLDGTTHFKGEGHGSRSVDNKSTRSVNSYLSGEPMPPPYDPYYHHGAYPYVATRCHYPPYYAGYLPPPAYREAPPPHGWLGYHPHDPPLYHPSRYQPRGLEYPPRPPYSGSHPSSYERPTASPAPPIVKEEASSEEKKSNESPEASTDVQPDVVATVAAAAASSDCTVQGEEVPTKIESVEDWQVAARATGSAPSAFRCVPLKEPIPSKCWGTLEHAETVNLPDFHRLVNYPDYLIKNYPNYLKKTNKAAENGASNAQMDKNGKRHCVMCGEERLCSASSAQPTPSIRVRAPQTKKNEPEVDEETGDDEGSEAGETTHIIPRQNKGLCTACDITVWVVMDSASVTNRLEIKWCKGCKNFRPWGAFGDKGMATKCVRCRDRQREKYAIQKDKLRANRQTKKVADEIQAARGLRDLMAASL